MTTQAARSFMLGLDGSMTSLKAISERSPLFNKFMGIDDDQLRIRDEPKGYAEVYAISTVMWRCINVIADTFASLPLSLKDKHGKVIENHPLKTLIEKRGARLRRGTAKDMLIFGNAYWLPFQNRIRRLNPLTIEIEKDHNGIHLFRQRIDGGVTGEWQPDELIYFFDYNPMDDLGGLSPTQVALRAISVELNLETFVAAFFENDAVPSLLLTTEKSMSESDKERNAAWWKRLFQGSRNAHKTAILTGGLKAQQLTSSIKDLVVDVLDENYQRKICQAYGVPMTMALATDAANFSTSKEQHQSFYTETLLPFADKILAEVNLQYATSYGEVFFEVDRQQIDVLQEDRTEITERASQGYTAGYMSMNDARRMEKLPVIDGGDVFLISGQLVTEKALATGKLPLLQPMNPFSAFLPSSQKATLLASGSSKTEQVDGSVVLNLANNPSLIELATRLKEQLINCTWIEPSDYHVTLNYMPKAAIDTLRTISKTLKAFTVDDIEMDVLGVGTFDSINLHLQVSSPSLRQFQKRIYDITKALDVEQGEYSDPASWIPHISIATCEALPQDLPRVDPPVTIIGYGAYCSAGNDNGKWEILGTTKASKKIKTPIKIIEGASRITRELKQWRSKVLQKGVNIPFETHVLKSTQSDFIRMDLLACDSSTKAIHVVFDRYMVKDVIDDSLATPEEFEAFWHDIGGLFDDLSQTFLDVWDKFPQKVADTIRETNAAPDMGLLLQEMENELTASLTGTVENPGILMQIFLAGSARGNDLLQNTRLVANPSKAMDLTIAWDIVNQQAVDWANQNAGSLVVGINDSTQTAFQEPIATWIETGAPLSDLADVIEGKLEGVTIPEGWSPKKLAWATSPQRAAVIAQTEATVAFFNGVVERWQAVGVKGIIFKTQNDRRVCPICLRLNNTKGTIVEGWQDPLTGEFVKIPVHIGCRCFAAPDTEGLF